VMDIGAMQDLFGRGGQLTRIDLRLQAGTDRNAFVSDMQAAAVWPANLRLTPPADGLQRISNLSRAYRVNLTVLALVALFTGAFLVFSVLALSVAKRAQQFALLRVLGLGPRACLRLVLAEALAIGALGSVAGIALGTALAWLALRLLGGDLGGGYFPGTTPALHWDASAAGLYALLGVAAALIGGWLPARAAQQLPAAQTLKGLGIAPGGGSGARLALWSLLGSALLCLAPPVLGLPLAAYLAIGLLLVGGITLLPPIMAMVFDRLAPMAMERVLPMLVMERARRVRGSAAVAISGVVAALSLAVALTVMVASFRASVDRWLDVVLPADLFMRTAGNTLANETAYFPPAFVDALKVLPGVQQVATSRSMLLSLEAARPGVTLLSRDLADPQRSLPMLGASMTAPPGMVAIHVSEAMVDLYGARLGLPFKPLSDALDTGTAPAPVFFVAGVWRDYARQFGSVAIDKSDFERITADTRISDLSLWLSPGADSTAVQQRVRELALQYGGPSLVDIASAGELRSLSLRIFDRSFAVTYWLQAVAIAIGLFGVAANFSAQVLARRKEFGLLSHLGLTRRQILQLVASEGLAWTAVGALAGLLLGLAVSAVLVHIVNPQSFHWTMDLLVPWQRLAALCAATIVAGTATAWLAARAAAGAQAVLAVKEDW
jgi:putative ABC transport system permease protein